MPDILLNFIQLSNHPTRQLWRHFTEKAVSSRKLSNSSSLTQKKKKNPSKSVPSHDTGLPHQDMIPSLNLFSLNLSVI